MIWARCVVGGQGDRGGCSWQVTAADYETIGDWWARSNYADLLPIPHVISTPAAAPPRRAQVKGYRRILFCQSVRDDVAGALGHGAWSHLLPRMCEGRLVPTPWLNKVGGGVPEGGLWRVARRH